VSLLAWGGAWKASAWRAGAWLSGALVAPGALFGRRRPPRRTRQYEEYLRAIVEGSDRHQTDPLSPRLRPYQARAALPRQRTAEPGIAIRPADDWFRAYQEARLAYARALLAQWQAEDDALLILLFAT
jgi:hypothetical protein